MSIYHSENQYQYNSKEEYRDKKKNGWHYTYLIIVDHRVPDESRKYYIGVHTSKNCLPEDSPYLGSSVPLTEFLEEHPETKVTKTILAYFLTRDDAGDHEIELHAEFKVASNPEYFNLAEATSTGFCRAGTTHSDEARQKLSESKKSYYADPANANKNPGKSEKSRKAARERMLSDQNPSKHQTVDTIEKIKNTAKINMQNMTKDERSLKFGNFGTNNSFYGNKHSSQTRKIISQKVKDDWVKHKRIWMHNFLGKNIRVPLLLINEAYSQGCNKGYAPGTHPNYKR